MNLLLINWQDRLNPQAGGAEIHLTEIFRRLVERGDQVTILTSGWSGAPDRQEVDGMTVLRVGSRYTFGALAPRYYRGQLATHPFDLTIEALNKVPVFSPLWSRSPVVLLVHHLFGTTAFREAALPLAALTWLLERPIPRVYDGVPLQAISRSTADDLLARGLHPREVRVIHPGVDLSFFTPAPASRAVEPTFLYLGRLKRYKGVELIIQAVSRLREEGADVRLVIGGRGDREKALRALSARLQVADRVEFAGFVSEQQKVDLFRSSWANVFASPKEGWGITNLEAAACGTPTIASDSPGLRESVIHGATGLLVPHGDVAALAAAMRELAGSRHRMETLGAGARAFAAGFGWDRKAEETRDHFQSVIQHGRALSGTGTSGSS